MNIVRLFHVLVVGGSLLAGSSCTGGDDDAPAADAPSGGPDSSSPGIDAAALPDGPAGPDGALLQDCFCNTDHDTCCDGTQVRDGFTCCWSTTC